MIRYSLRPTTDGRLALTASNARNVRSVYFGTEYLTYFPLTYDLLRGYRAWLRYMLTKGEDAK